MRKSFGLLVVLLFVVSGCAKKSEGWEMVLHARGGQIESNRLVLEDLNQHVSLFTVGKPRQVAAVSLQDMVEHWDELFAKSQPNATVSLVTKDGLHKEQVVILKKPKLVGNKLEFTIDALNGSYQGGFQEAVVYVDAMTAEKEIQNSAWGDKKRYQVQAADAR